MNVLRKLLDRMSFCVILCMRERHTRNGTDYELPKCLRREVRPFVAEVAQGGGDGLAVVAEQVAGKGSESAPPVETQEPETATPTEEPDTTTWDEVESISFVPRRFDWDSMGPCPSNSNQVNPQYCQEKGKEFYEAMLDRVCDHYFKTGYDTIRIECEARKVENPEQYLKHRIDESRSWSQMNRD